MYQNLYNLSVIRSSVSLSVSLFSLCLKKDMFFYHRQNDRDFIASRIGWIRSYEAFIPSDIKYRISMILKKLNWNYDFKGI